MLCSCASLRGVGTARVRVRVSTNLLSEIRAISQSQNTVMIEHVSCSIVELLVATLL